MAIMVGFDETISAGKALQFAIAEAKHRNTSIWLVHAVPKNRIPDHHKKEIMQILSSADVSERYVGALPDALAQELHRAEKLIEEAGIEWETRILVRGQSAGEDLMTFIFEMREHIEMVVIGVHKTSAVGKAVFGSTAQYLILHAPCPVAPVNPGVKGN